MWIKTLCSKTTSPDDNVNTAAMCTGYMSYTETFYLSVNFEVLNTPIKILSESIRERSVFCICLFEIAAKLAYQFHMVAAINEHLFYYYCRNRL